MDLDSRARQAVILAMDGQRDAAIAAYESLFSDMESGQRHFAEAEWRSDFARILHEAGDPREAQQLTKAVALFQRQGDVPRLVDACLRLARFHRDSAAAAVYWVDRAVAAAERGADPATLCLALACRGELLLGLGRAEEALAALQKAVALPGGEAHENALASAKIAAGQTDAGLETLTHALEAARRSEGDGAAERVVGLTMRMSDARRALGDPGAALALLEEAAGRANELTDGALFALLMDRLGLALHESGDSARAVRTLERGIERLRNGQLPAGANLASLFNNLGNALTAIGNYPGAIRSYAEAIRLTRGVNLKSEAIARIGLANAAATAGDLTYARDAYEEARGLAVRLQDRQLEAACLDSLGQLHMKAREPGKAIDLHRRAAWLHGEGGDRKGQHTDLLNLVQSLLLLGETRDARRALDDAREIAKAHLGSVPWQQALHEGQVLAREDRWPLACDAFEAAIAQLETERASLQTPNDQRQWAAHRVEAFEIATTAAFEARDAGAAWSFLEGNRARFLEAVSERRRRLPQGLPAATRTAYTAAVDRLSQLRWRRRQHPEIVDRQLEVELASAERVWRELDAEVELLRVRQHQPAEAVPQLEEVAESLTDGEAAVALHADPGWIGAACVGRASDGELWWACDIDRGFTLGDVSRTVVGRAEGEEATGQPAWQDLASLPLADAQALVAATCDRLGHAIWPLVERLLQGRATALVLMPGRGLNVLPLHATATSDGRLAMDRWSVRFAPSLRLFASAGRPATLPPTKTLGQVINPTGDLPFAETEAAAIRRAWRGAQRPPLAGTHARPDEVLALFGDADVLHFAGHGAFDPDDPLRSRLLCAPGEPGGVLTLQTVLDRITAARARVVLLSACETGRVVAGDPLNDQLGLPGGLLIAGAAAVLATYWPVDDLAACLVLSRCIGLWEQTGVDLERALADAQAWLREQATVGVVLDWLDEQIDACGATEPQLELAYGRLSVRDSRELPFAGAIHWAPFHVTGRAVRAG